MISKDLVRSKDTSIIPSGILRRFGCTTCEWRSTDRCPNLHDSDFFSDLASTSICHDRKIWLVSHVPDYSSPPSSSLFIRDFCISLGLDKLGYSQSRLEFYENRLAMLHDKFDMTNDPVEKQQYFNQIKNTEKNITKFQNYWQTVWSKVLNYEDMQHGREQPRQNQLDVTVNGLDRLRATVEDSKEVNVKILDKGVDTND